MKKILGFICLVAILASCDVTIDSHEPVNGADSSAIGFNVYVNRGVTTKAGYKGDLTTAKLENEAGGFGVFAYYGDGALYNETSKPDFMYNQPVTYNPTYEVWDYKPVKYWPNEYGTAAGSQSADRLTFFAYAPYVDVTPSTGIVTEEGETGILGMTRNIAPGDPMIRYGANFKPGQGVDLCWGVAKEAFTSSVDGSSNDVKAGEPFLNVVKPKTGDRLKFDFNHALTQLNVTVDADIDVENGETGTLATETKIYVRSVTFTGFTARGSLNLNSKAGNPAWFDMAGTGRVNRDPVIIHDGRSDGMEGVPTATDVNELPRGLNPKIIQTGEATVGVTNEKVNLFESNDDDAPIMVIPVAGVPMTVTIVYDIETEDPSLGSFLSDGSTHGISIENKITRSIKMNSADLTLVSGRKYTINLHLGLTSVKFDATVGGWDDNNYSSSVDMPINTSTMSGVTLTPSSSTVWAGEGSIALPAVSVKVMHNTTEVDVTDASTISWKTLENPEVASYDATNQKININGVGVAKIRATAIYQDQTMTADYTVNVNKVTGITISPSSGDFIIGRDQDYTATLTFNSPINGTITDDDMPVVTWTKSESVDLTSTSSVSTMSGNNAVATNTASTTTSAVVGEQVTVSVEVAAKYTGERAISDSSSMTFAYGISLYLSSTSGESVDDFEAYYSAVTLPGGTVATPIPWVFSNDDVSFEHNLAASSTFTWESSNTSLVEVDESGHFTITSSDVAGRVIITVTATYLGKTSSREFEILVYKVGYFRGYDVSKGILMRTVDVVTGEATYSLTQPTNDNQFEVLDYYGNSESKNKYYFQWSLLREELGQDADENIKADSNKLPAGWTIPGSGNPPEDDGTGWFHIVFGEAVGITVNGQTVSYGYALVNVTTSGSTVVPALLLVPDGTTIELSSLEGKEDYFDDGDGDYGYDKIPLSLTDYEYLMSKSCRFLPVTGYFDEVVNHNWIDGLTDYYPIGYYWANDRHDNDDSEPFFLEVEYFLEQVCVRHGISINDFCPVRLIKSIL